MQEPDFEKIEKDIEREHPEKGVDFGVEKETEQGITGEELLEERKKIKMEMEKEIEKIKISPQVKTQAQQQADNMKKQSTQGKIKHLLELAQTQGLAYSVEVAKNMNDAYLLDLYHDELAKEGRYKQFLEQ